MGVGLPIGSSFQIGLILQNNPAICLLTPADRSQKAGLKLFLSEILSGMGCAPHRAVADLFARLESLHRSLDFHLERHNLLASNIAHVNTPGFRPVDIERVDATSFGDTLTVAMRRTESDHMAVGGTSGVNGRVVEDLTAGGGADGNFVSLDREASKLTANQLRYDIVSVLVSSQLSGLMNAASDGKG